MNLKQDKTVDLIKMKNKATKQQQQQKIIIIIYFSSQHKTCLDKYYNIFQTTRFNHAMIFFKLIQT